MEFTPITEEEFPLTNQVPSAVAAAVRSLKEIGAGFSTPCIWKHPPIHKSCGGYRYAYYAARRAKIRVRITCQDGTFYVLRVEDKQP